MSEPCTVLPLTVGSVARARNRDRGWVLNRFGRSKLFRFWFSTPSICAVATPAPNGSSLEVSAASTTAMVTDLVTPATVSLIVTAPVVLVLVERQSGSG